MRKKTIVVADDLTGANATGVLMRKQGLSAFVFLHTDHEESSNRREKDIQTRFDTIIYTTDSRNLAEREAYDRVKNVCDHFVETENFHFSKRIDSTLRGNIRVELEAMRQSFPEYCVLVMPVFPGAGRYCINGLLFLGDKRLEDTEVTKDPLFPVNSSKVCEILQVDQENHISLSVLDSGEEAISEELKKLYQQGKRIIIIDGKTDEHIQTFARAAVKADIPFISSDPGPLTSHVSAILQEKSQTDTISGGKIVAQSHFEDLKKGKIFLSVGTSVQVTKRQIDFLCQRYRVGTVEMIVEDLLKNQKKEIERIYGVFQNRNESILLLHTDSLSKGVRIEAGDKNEEIAEMIKTAFAELTIRLWEKDPLIYTIICSGGDITSTICAGLNVSGIEIIEEVAPLISFGRISKENLQSKRDLYMVTKGGLAGNPDAFIRCVQFLKN